MHCGQLKLDVDVSENSGTPKSSILIGFSIKNHPFWGTPIFGNTHVDRGIQASHNAVQERARSPKIATL